MGAAIMKHMLGSAAIAGVAITVLGLLTTNAYAQTGANRGSTTSGMFGSTSLGGTSGASPQALGQGMTTGMSGNSTQGGSGTGGAQGGTPMGQSQMQAGGGMQQVQAGGATGFVGISSANNQQAFNASGQRGLGNQNFNALRQLATQSRQNQFNAQQAQKAGRTTTQAQSQFRVPLKLGFLPTAAANNAPMPKLQTSLTKVPGMTKLGPIEASLEGTTAVLRGRVATEADRQLAEGLARLEPGVGAVRNELVVGSAAATTTESLPSPTSSTP
jgi:hypothetical protein